MIITAKFGGVCPKCGKAIAAGSKVEWERGGKATHVDCGAAAASPATPKRAPAPRAQFCDQKPKPGAITTRLREEPCKRAQIPSYIGETRRLSDAAAREHGCRYYVVETQSAWYASSDANEDNGDYEGACWWVTLGGRPATPEEAAVEERERTHTLMARVGTWFACTLGPEIERLAARERAS